MKQPTSNTIAFKEKHKHPWLRHWRQYWQLHVMALPTVLCLCMFSYLPMFGLVMAFQDYSPAKGFLHSPFVGMKNFEFLFATRDAWVITRNTVCYNTVFILLNTFLAVLLALVLHELTYKRLAKFFQTVFIMPHFLSMAVVSIILYAFLSPVDGYVNHLLTALGGQGRNWYIAREIWPMLLVFISAWKHVGYSAVVYMASISGISQEYYEAAMLDGATKMQQAIHITLPYLRPMITIMLILNVGNIFRGDFGLFYTVTQNNGMLYPVTDVIDTYIYRALTTLNNTGMSTAAGLYQSLVGFFMVLLSNWVVKRLDPDSALF
ncbi:MAG: ABC transporter permease subunit [Angelakisella sp.]